MDHNQNQQQVDHTKETKPVSAESNKIENPIPHTSDYAPYPKLDPKDVAPPAENWASVSMAAPSSQSHPGPAPISGAAATTMPAESNPYVSPAPVAPSSSKNTMDTVKDVLGKWGKKATEATKKAEDLAGNMWQH